VRIFAGKLGEMSINEPLIDSRSYVWVIGLGLNFFKDATQFKSVGMSKGLEYLASGDT
jgi:hypothetical protein